MNATLCKTESWVDSLFHETTETPALRDLYATMPVKATRLEFDWQREEEASTSFEAAISLRVLALKERRLSANGNTTSHIHYVESSLLHDTTCNRRFFQNIRRIAWQRVALLAATALMLMLVGFDLMGLLVLSMR